MSQVTTRSTGAERDSLTQKDRLPTPARTTPAAAVVALAGRSLLKLRHVPEQAADAILIPVLFTLLFTYLFGGALSGSTGAYLQFLLPGTLVMTVLLLTVTSGISLNTDRSRGVLDRFRSLPIWQPALVVGGLLGDICRYLLASGLVIGMGLVMGFRPAGGAIGVLLGVGLAVVFAFAISWPWALIGLLMRSPQAVSITSFVVQFPLTFASNVFVDPATMPGWLRAFVDVNPVSLLVTAERGLMQGTATFGDVAWVLVASAAILAVFGPLTMRAYRRA